MRKVENLHFFGIGEKNYPDWSWMVDTLVKNTPFGFSLSGKKIESIILDT